MVDGTGNEGFPRSPIEANLEHLQARYGIAVQLDQSSAKHSDNIGFVRTISYDTLSRDQAQEIILRIKQELALYPPDYIRAIGLKKIIPVRNLRESSLAGKISDIGGIPMPKQGLLYLSTDRDFLSLIQGIHHEVSHFSDNESSGLRGIGKRKAWVTLNPQGSNAYKVVDEYLSNREIESERPKGFASMYGSFNPDEDRAEVASLVMSMARAPGGHLRRMLQGDDVLRAKAEAVIAGITAKSRLTVDNYLEDLQNKIVYEQYWDNGLA